MEWNRGHQRDMPRGVCCGKWSGARCRDLPEGGGPAPYPSQEVELDHDRYCGLPGSDGAAWKPSQEVEQNHGRYCGLPGGPDLSAEVRLESDFRSSPDGDHLSRNLGRDLQQEFRVEVRLPWEPEQILPVAGVRGEVRLP